MAIFTQACQTQPLISLCGMEHAIRGVHATPSGRCENETAISLPQRKGQSTLLVYFLGIVGLCLWVVLQNSKVLEEGTDRKETTARAYATDVVNQTDAARLRSVRYELMQQVLEILQVQNCTALFAQKGLSLAAIRNRGFTPFDMDPDFAILEQHLPALRQVQWPAPFGITFSTKNLVEIMKYSEMTFTMFTIWTDTERVMTGYAYPTEPENNSSVIYLAGNPGGVPKATALPKWTFDVVDVPFYCGSIPVPRGVEVILGLEYGDDWASLQLNKCSVKSPTRNKHQCRTVDYSGARHWPYRQRVNSSQINLTNAASFAFGALEPPCGNGSRDLLMQQVALQHEFEENCLKRVAKLLFCSASVTISLSTSVSVAVVILSSF